MTLILSYKTRKNQRHSKNRAADSKDLGNLRTLDGGSGSLLGGHLFPDLGGDVPNELKGSPGAQDKQSGNQHAQDLEAEDGACALHIQLGLVAHPIQGKEADAQTDGLADAAGQIEGAVDGAFGALAGDRSL